MHQSLTVMKTWGSVLIGAFLLVLAGCGGDSGSPEPVSSAGPTYHGEVARVLSANCASCHTAGGIAPFPLDTPEWAVRMAPAIAYVSKEGIMPPWPPGPDSPPLQNERTLSPEEINLLVDWAEAGALVGDPDNQPLDSYAEAIAQDLQPDLVLTVDPPYQPDQSRQDDYRCFLLDPDLERDAFVSSYRVRPEQATMVHHALLYVISPRAVARAEAVDGGEAGPGWTCFGGPGVGSDISTLDILGVWVPGGGGTAFPEGTGKLLKAGSRLIMQLHYNLAAREGVGLDSSSVDLFLASPTDELKPIHELALAAPVEVRCPGPYPADPAEPCNRTTPLSAASSNTWPTAFTLHAVRDPRSISATTSGTGAARR